MANLQPIASEADTEDNSALVAAVQEGIEAADAGRIVPYEAVRRWLLSWGTEAELPPPPCP
jgi:predicted transcriptional regulator